MDPLLEKLVLTYPELAWYIGGTGVYAVHGDCRILVGELETVLFVGGEVVLQVTRYKGVENFRLLIKILSSMGSLVTFVWALDLRSR